MLDLVLSVAVSAADPSAVQAIDLSLLESVPKSDHVAPPSIDKK